MPTPPRREARTRGSSDRVARAIEAHFLDTLTDDFDTYEIKIRRLERRLLREIPSPRLRRETRRRICERLIVQGATSQLALPRMQRHLPRIDSACSLTKVDVRKDLFNGPPTLPQERTR